MDLTFGISSTERLRGDMPSLPVINMFAEQAATEAKGVVLQSRSGLIDREADMGTGPVEAVFQHDGVLSDTLFGVSGGKLYQGITGSVVMVGTVDGNGPFSIAGYEDYIFIAGGRGLWGYDGVTFSAVPFPDSAHVVKVLIGASRAICIRSDTEKFYWSEVLLPTIDSLSFATAESQPDGLMDGLFIDGILILFGSETVEFWPAGTDADLPFTPLIGRVFERGIKATGCATAFGATFAWVTDTNQVCVSDPENIISQPGLEALIEASERVRLQNFTLEGTEFLWLKIDSGDWVYSIRSRTWSQFASYGHGNWLPSCFSAGVFGSSVDGRTFAWGDQFTDLDGVMERRFRAGSPINSGGMIISNVVLRNNVGTTAYLSGDYANPVVEMRSSRDAGQTWGAWRPASLGAQGQYRKRVQWKACGMASQPGILLEFRVTDRIGFRVSQVLVNEPLGGI